MDVVRFNESDVIVASGVRTLSVIGVGDNERFTASLSIGGGNFSSTEVRDGSTDFRNTYNSYMSGITTYNPNSTYLNGTTYTENVLLRNAFEADARDWGSADTKYEWANGNYEWNGSVWQWTSAIQQ